MTPEARWSIGTLRLNCVGLGRDRSRLSAKYHLDSK